jgi:hypothetical protein
MKNEKTTNPRKKEVDYNSILETKRKNQKTKKSYSMKIAEENVTLNLNFFSVLIFSIDVEEKTISRRFFPCEIS